MKKIDSQFQRGIRHGRLGVWNPGFLRASHLEQYKGGWHEGRRHRFVAINEYLKEALDG